MKRWKTLDSQIILECPWMTLTRQTCQRPDGLLIDDYYIIREPDVGCIFALTPDHEVVLVEQYKHGIGEVCLELPAGYFTGKDDPMAQARREFMEETGYDALSYHYVGALPQHPTRLTSQMHLIAALDARPQGPQNLDENEHIAVRLFPIDEVFTMIRAGNITAVGTVAGIYLACDYLKAER
jgi:8-oxo-dGTP pyrophosphatase MutT (NUDIX family)